MNDDGGVALDPEAQRLFEQLGGLEAFQKGRPTAGTRHLAESLLEAQKRHDAVRILMVQATWLLSRCLADEHFAVNEERETRVLGKMAEVMGRLCRAPAHLGFMLIRFRGTPSDLDLPQVCDYELVLGHTLVDSRIALDIARRSGGRWPKLPDQLREAFTVLAGYGVNNIYLRLPVGDPSAFQLCLKILSGFRNARVSGKPILVQTGAQRRTVPLINDENLFPDPNLTMIAGLNRFSAKAMETLVEKVDRRLRQREVTSAVHRYAGVYNAVLGVPKLRDQIKKPPVELNNVKWLIVETENQVVSAEKVRLAKLAMDLSGASPQQAAKMIQSVYGDDYARINKLILGERLHLSSNLLHAADQRPKESHLTRELLGNLQVRLDLVKDEVMDDIHVLEEMDEDRRMGKAPAPGAVHSQVYRMVSFLKGRSATRKKMVGMVRRPISFTARDYEILARDFRISVAEAEMLVRKLKACFGAEGRFSKSAFADAVDLFRRYEQKIFHFLWHHMKDVVLPEDRTAFLNALQALTAQMDQPKKAMKILLEDLCADPAVLQFSDNKAIMLANLIVHRDKSMTDYDVTPEDIVLSRHSIDTVVAQYAAWRIEKAHDLFSGKVQTIHKKLIEALHLGQTGDQQIPVAVLLNLERELFIFLSLVPCDTGKLMLRSAADEYGDPAAAIYHQKESERCMGPLLQNLRVAVRGVGCAGGMGDVPALERIKAHEETFLRLKKDRNHRAQARLITEWVDEAVKIIKFRC
jgi:hypothetical protein